MSNGQVKSVIERAMRLHDERDQIAGDIAELLAEAKSDGLDKAAIRAVVAHLRKVAKAGEAAVSEAETVFDLYLRAAKGEAPHVHVHEGASATVSA
ncbi:MAG: GapR family DNA-binding domain-containing protein [Bosea sp. (in: a-proteobacteria)]